MSRGPIFKKERSSKEVLNLCILTCSIMSRLDRSFIVFFCVLFGPGILCSIENLYAIIVELK